MIETFELSGRKFAYARSEYNSTPICERAVEVPVGLALLGQATDGERAVLEVGAVLPHYRVGWPADGHTVIDLHEEYAGVINADVLTWEPPHVFDLIISISTLDHLRNEDEFHCALVRLRSWLAPAGLLFVTLPYGQPAWVGGGAWIDRYLLGENDATAVISPAASLTAPRAAETWRMDKIDMVRHLWAQVHDMTLPPLAYHGPSLFANSVYFLLWGDVERWWQT